MYDIHGINMYEKIYVALQHCYTGILQVQLDQKRRNTWLFLEMRTLKIDRHDPNFHRKHLGSTIICFGLNVWFQRACLIQRVWSMGFSPFFLSVIGKILQECDENRQPTFFIMSGHIKKTQTVPKNLQLNIPKTENIRKSKNLSIPDKNEVS